jgi:hypothetical protein
MFAVGANADVVERRVARRTVVSFAMIMCLVFVGGAVDGAGLCGA